MAKKKAAADAAEEKNPLDSVFAQLAAKYGEGLAVPGREVADEKRVIIPVSPYVDVVLGGGIPEGSWVSLSGPEKHGKTTLALSFAANAQLPQYGSRPVFFFAVEHRLKSRDLQGIRYPGLDLASGKFTVIKSREGKLISSKEMLEMAEQIISDVPGAVIIIDSVSALCSSAVEDGELGVSDYGRGNVVISQFVERNKAKAVINRSIVIGIIHFYVNSGKVGRGPSKVEKAASRWKYQCDVGLIGTYAKPWRVGSNEDSQQIGQEVEWVVKTTGTNAMPGTKTTNYLRYGTGIDKTYEMLKLGQDCALIDVAGAWYTLTFLSSHSDLLAGTEFESKPVKVQGAEKAYDLLLKNPAWADALNSELKAVVGN